MGYINGDFPQPNLIDPTHNTSRTENPIFKGWIINFIDQSLIGDFIWFTNTKHVSDSIATTYFDQNERSHIYELKRSVTRKKKVRESFEASYNNLQGL